jgi:hypothetical protein
MSCCSASIHLHHLYAMPEVNFDLKVCGITTGFQLLELQQTNASDDYSENVFRPSLGKIVTSSRALMGLMRSAYKTSVFAMTQHTLPSTGISAHIPKVDTPSADEPLAVTEDILHHSPFCGCSQVVAAFGAALEVATATSKWQAMAAESNFETSKMVLQRLKRVWPVAAVFEGQRIVYNAHVLPNDPNFSSQMNWKNAMVRCRVHFNSGDSFPLTVIASVHPGLFP